MQTQVVVMTDAVVARGQAAWSRIKSAADEHRELWRHIGEALSAGRKKHPSNQAFGKWLRETGFDEIDKDNRASAIWLANHWLSVSCSGVQKTAHYAPSEIRRWFNEQERSTALPEELNDTEIEIKSVPTMDRETAEKVAKLANRAASGDEGSEIAQRHLEAVAKKHGVSADDLAEAASIQVPETFYHFTPDQTEQLEELRTFVMGMASDLDRIGLSAPAIAKVFINVAQMLLTTGEEA